MPCAVLFCQHSLSALPSLSARVDQKAKGSDLPFGSHLADTSYGAACFFQFLVQAANDKILGGFLHLCIESAALGQPKLFTI